MSLHGARYWNQSINAVSIGTLTHLMPLRMFRLFLRNLVVFVTDQTKFFISSMVSLFDDDSWICGPKLSLMLMLLLLKF